jgi:hypothetical protein
VRSRSFRKVESLFARRSPTGPEDERKLPVDRLGSMFLLLDSGKASSGWRNGVGAIDPDRAVESAKLLYELIRTARPPWGGPTSVPEKPSLDAPLAAKLPLLRGSVGLEGAPPPSGGPEGGNAVTCEVRWLLFPDEAEAFSMLFAPELTSRPPKSLDNILLVGGPSCCPP